MRKLATVRKITKLTPIEGADKIELATIDGWNVIVAKDVGHKVGDQVVYCEVDSFLPIKPEFEFLRKSSYRKLADGSEGFRLKTMKMRGVVSQGLILPMSVLGGAVGFADGMEVTKMLGITKWDPPLPANLAGKVKGYFPSFIPKTDEERIQNFKEEYEDMKNHEFYVTEKLDGSSATFYFYEGRFGVCSRNLELAETDDNSFWKVAREMELEDRLRMTGNDGIAIQGELIGEGIQKNPYGLKGQTVRFFSAFDINTQSKINFHRFEELITETLQLQTVPILHRYLNLPDTIEQVIAGADGASLLNNKTAREGLVYRTFDRKYSFKAISNKFLLKAD
jgi:RNA ligase (TIGR02306 family)